MSYQTLGFHLIIEINCLRYAQPAEVKPTALLEAFWAKFLDLCMRLDMPRVLITRGIFVIKAAS